ncbi:hypothetical protein AX16_009189 [Volvariella volvacea WC 439]|nr:hypothetical protein AX16_009189 [Volvariella volvacea WC 439]
MSDTPKTQKALFLDAPHGNLVVEDTEVYTPEEGELLVKIRSIALNPVDWKIKKYNVFVKEYPAILGSDIAGDVVKVEAGVTRFKVGDKIFFQGASVNRYAAYQQYTLADQAIGAKIPENATYDDASTIPVAFTCIYLSLYHKLGFTPPTTTYGGAGKYSGVPLVIIGGSGSVGQYGLQLAKLSAFSPIITYASAKHEAHLKSLGATHVIDRQTTPLSSLPSAVRAITGSVGVPYIIDVISSAETQQAAYDAVDDGGKVGLVLAPTLKEKEGSGKQVLPVVGVRDDPAHKHILEDAYLFLEEWIRNGTIRTTHTEVLPGGLKGIDEGLKRLEANGVSGVKLVVRPNDA